MLQLTKSTVVFLVVVVITTTSALGTDASGQRAYWPNGYNGAVSLTFDDGLPSQLKNAIPLLNRHRIKATFYVNPNYSLDWEKNIPGWSKALANGHELGNHTDRHTCSCRHSFGANLSFCLDQIKISDIARVIDGGRKGLRKVFAGALVDRSFAYPCYESFVGVGTRRISYIPEVAKRYLAARAGGYRSNNPLIANLAHLASYSVDKRTIEQTEKFIESQIAKGQWVILTFHGVGGDWLSVDAEYLARTLKFLHENRLRIWTAPLFTIAQYILRRRKAYSESLQR